MKTKSLALYWLAVPLLIAAYIVTMAVAVAKEHADGPHAYASPNPPGHAYGLDHGKGKPDKIP